MRLRILAVVVAARISSDVMCEYQTSRSRIVAYSAIRARYDSTAAMAACRPVPFGNPTARAPITKLAAIRFTSHSHGPGSVSSKSFRSNNIRRSGEPKTPKFDRCASPQICALIPLTGVPARSSAITIADPR